MGPVDPSAENSILNRMGAAPMCDPARDGFAHLSARDKRPGGALVQQGLERRPFEIFVLPTLAKHVDPLLQQLADV